MIGITRCSFVCALAIASGCMMDPEIGSTEDQELATEMLDEEGVTPEALASDSDEISDENDLEAGTALDETDVGTDGVREFAVCMYFELGFRLAQNCVDVCVACVAGNWFTRPINCGLCATCAGVNGVQAARECADRL